MLFQRTHLKIFPVWEVATEFCGFFASLLRTRHRHPPSTATRTPTSHPHNLAPCSFERQHVENKLRAIACSSAFSNSQHSCAGPETNFESGAVSGVPLLVEGVSTRLPALFSLPLDADFYLLPFNSSGAAGEDGSTPSLAGKSRREVRHLSL